MRHERIAARLSDYLEGSLSKRDTAQVEAHLLGCAGCRQALGEMKRTIDLLRSLRGSVEAPDLASVVMARVRAGEAEPSVLDRLRAGVSRFLSGPLGAPLATGAVGLALLAVLPRIEVEVSIPGRATSVAPAAVATRQAPQARSGQPTSSPPLLTRRVREPLSLDPFSCLEAPSPQACRNQHAFMTRLARENAWAFVEQLEAVPEPSRNALLHDLSRYAAESGAAPDVARELRATGNPLAQRMAAHFEEAR